MNRIVISGYYGAGNAGDEAILEALLSAIRRFDPNIAISVLSFTPERTAADYGVKALHRYRLKDVFFELRRADLLISGGGGLLQDATGPCSIPYYLGVVALARLAGTPAVLLGQSLGPVRRRISRALLRMLLPLASRAVVRDDDSYALARELGYPTERLTSGADLVFGGSLPEREAGAALLADIGITPGTPRIAVALRQWGDNGHLESTGRALRIFAEVTGCQPLFLSFQLPDDMEASRAACAAAGCGQVLERPCGHKELRNIICNTDMLLGMRYHSLIFAALGDLPSVGIEYDPKVTAAVLQLGIPSAGQIDLLSAQGLAEVLQQAWSARDELRKNMASHLSPLRSRAFAEVEEILVPFLRGYD